MASYDAVIKLVVQGEDALKRIQDRVDKLYKTIDDLEKKKKYAGSEAAAAFVREQAEGLERVLATSKQIIKQDEQRIVKQSRLNSAVDLYERRLKQTVNSGAAGLKKFEGQIKEIEAAFKFFKDRGNVTAVQALATELGRMVEYSNNVSRNERARVANQSKVFEYTKKINEYEELGLKVAEAREKFEKFTAVSGTNQLNQAKKYEEALKRQLKLLEAEYKQQVKTQTGIVKGIVAEEAARKKADDQRYAAQQRFMQLTERAHQQALANTEEYVQSLHRTEAARLRELRIAKLIEQQRQAAGPAQLLLPAAAPGAPEMSGGARRRITGPVERLGGARTEDEAAMALRFAQALKEQIRPLSQIQALYAGIAQQAAQMQRIKALPDSAMLNAAGRGIQALSTAQDRYNAELQDSAARLQQLDRLEQSRERRRAKLQGIAEYYAGDTGAAAAAGFGANVPGMPLGTKPAKAPKTGLQAPGVMDAILGAGFPVLFGGGPGAVLGGAAGGLIGGAMSGMAGMALSVALSAVGQQIDTMVKKFADLGEAIKTLNVDAVRDSYIFVNRELDLTLNGLLKAGEYEKARAVLANEAARQTGASTQQIAEANNAMNQLQGAWAQVTAAVGGLVSLVTVPLLQGITATLKIVSLIAVGASKVVSFTRDIVGSVLSWLAKLAGVDKFYNNLVTIIPFISEEQEKLRAASDAAADAGIRDIQLKKQLLDLERARVEGSNRLAQQSQIDAAFTREKLTAEKELADEIKRINREGAQLTEQQRALEIAIAQAKTEQKIDEAAITKEKAQQRLLNDAIIAGLQDQANALQTQADQYAKAQASTASILQIELQRFQQRAQFVTSLNQEAALINQIAANRKKAAEIEYQAAVASANSAVQQAAAEYEIVKAKYEQNNADIEQVNAAQRKLQTAIQARGLDVEIAGLKRQQAVETAELERRQAQVNAYAEEYARINERTTRQLEEQTNALSNRASLTAAISQAVQTINNLEIEGLTRELERTSSTERRAQIIDRIYKLEIENARVALEATRAQINAELARAEAAYRTVQLKYEELRAVVQLAEAEGFANRAHYAALEAQGSALRIAKDNLTTAGQIAQWQWKAADAVFKAAVDAAQLKKEMGGAASAAGQFAGNMERAASAARAAGLGQQTAGTPFAAMGGAENIQDPGLKMQAQKVWQDAEKFAATKGIASIQADILQRARDTIAQIAARDYILRSKSATSTTVLPDTTARASTPAPTAPTPIPLTQPLATGLSRQPGGGAGAAIVDRMPTINLQTGPVLQQDNGSKYVSLADLEKILQDFAAVVFNNARSTGGRRFQGVA